MAAKQNMVKNKVTRKNYKIESLEPRLLMDASHKMESWVSEIDSISAPEQLKNDDAIYDKISTSSSITGLYQKDKYGSFASAVNGKDLVEMDKSFTKYLPQPLAEDILDYVKKDIKSFFNGEKSSTKFTSKQIFETIKDGIVARNGARAYSASEGVVSTSIGFVCGDKVKSYVNVNYEVCNIGDRVFVNVVGNTSLMDYSPELGKLYREKASMIRADLKDIDSVGINANFDFSGYARSYAFSFDLDGVKKNGVDLSSSVMLYTMFDESHSKPDNRELAYYGVLGLNGDNDAAVDLLVGRRLTIDGKNEIVKNGVQADFEFELKKNGLFDKSTNMTSRKLKYVRNFLADEGTWYNYENGGLNVVEAEKYNRITMGQILGKLQELSIKLANVQNGELNNNVDFGSVLSQNCNGLMNLSKMLDDALVINRGTENARSPETIQEMVQSLNSSPYKSSNFKITVDEDYGCLVIPFHLKFVEEGNDVSTIKSKVSLARDYLEKALNVEIQSNVSVEVTSSATLSFNLVVPFKEFSRANADTPLYKVGLDKGDDESVSEFNDRLKTIIGTNSIIGSSDVKYKSVDDFDTYVKNVANKVSCSWCADSSTGIYALYMKEFEKEDSEIIESIDELADASIQSGFVLEWNKKCDKITSRKTDYTISGLTDAVDTLNLIFKLNPRFGANTEALAFSDKIIILFDGDESEMNYLAESYNLKMSNISLSFKQKNLQEVIISTPLSPKAYEGVVKLTVKVGNSEKTITFEDGAFKEEVLVEDESAENNGEVVVKGPSCVGDIAVALQERINKAFGWNTEKFSEELLHVECFGNRIHFVSTKNFKITFNDKKFADWLGFGNVDSISSSSKKADSSCMQILVDNDFYTVDLMDFANSKASSNGNLSKLTMGDILKEIARQINAKYHTNKSTTDDCVKVDGNKLKGVNGNTVKIIEDINGFNIASVMGLTGVWNSNGRLGRTSFRANAILSEEYQGKSAARFENFELEITNEITEGSVAIPAKYGVFGVNIKGNTKGLKCVTKFTIDKDTGKLSDIGTPSFTYSGNSKSLTMELRDTIGGVKDIGSLVMDVDDTNKSGENPFVSYYKKNSGLNDKLKDYEPSKLDIETVYEKVYKGVLELLYSYYSNGSQSRFKNSLLPIYGKDVLDIMDFESKFNDMKLFLSRGYSCTTLQEFSSAFEKETGVSLLFTLNKDGLAFDLNWHKVISQQVTELGNLGLGINGIQLVGHIEAFLNANLTMTAHFDIARSGNGYNVVLDTSTENKTAISGSVSIKAKKINTDMILNVVYDRKNYMNEFFVGSNRDKDSSLSVSASFNQDEDNSDENISMMVSGTLYLFRYGVYAGEVGIGVAKENGKYDNLKSSFDYSLENHAFGAVAVWQHEKKNVFFRNGVAAPKDVNVVKNDIVLDLSKISDLRTVTLTDRFCEVAEGMNVTVRRMQSSILSTLVQKQMREIPLIGDKIINVADCLDMLNERIVEPLRKFAYGLKSDIDGLGISRKFHAMLKTDSSFDIDPLDDCSKKSEKWADKTFNKYYNGIQYKVDQDENKVVTEACWRIRLKGTYLLDADADFDVGFPGLGLKGDGGVKISLEWTLDIGFGVSLTDGAFLLLSNGYDTKAESKESEIKKESTDATIKHVGDDFTAKVKIEPSAEIVGSLGFLTLKAALRDFTDADGCITLGFDFNDGGATAKEAVADWKSDKQAKTSLSFNTLGSDLSIECGLRGNLPINLDMMLGLGDSKNMEKIPHLLASLGVEWKSSLGQENAFGEISKVGFSGIVLDCGSIVNGTVGEVVKKINKVLEPIQPLIKFLKSEIPVLNKLPAGKFKMTVLDLVKKFGKGKMNFGFLDDLINMNETFQKLQEYTESGYKFKDIIFYDAAREAKKEVKNLNKIGKDYIDGKITNVEEFITSKDKFGVFGFALDKVDALSNLVNSFLDDATDKVLNALPAPKKDNEQKSPALKGNFKVPIMTDPANQVAKLLMGGHVDLVQFDMAPLVFSFDWGKSFPIVGPLCADVGFNFSVCIDLCFGYDTLGLEKWRASDYKDYAALIDGFYMSDWDDNGKDAAEVVFHSGVVAGASIGGRVGVNVGLNLNVNLDFVDPDNDGKIRLGEMASLLKTPLKMFDVSATIEAKAYAYLDYFFGTKKWTLWSSGALDLFKVENSKPSDKPILASDIGGETVVHVGKFAEERRNAGSDKSDGNDEVTITIKSEDTVDVKWGGYTQTNVKVGKDGTLAVYAGEGNDSITIKSDVKKDEEGNPVEWKKAKFNIKVYGENGNDTVNMSEAILDDGYLAVVMGGMGRNIIQGAKGGENYLFGEEGLFRYGKLENDTEKDRLKIAEAYSTNEAMGPNVIIGGDSTNVIFGGAGSDFIVGGNSTNYIFGDSGRYIYDTKTDERTVNREDLFLEGGCDLIYGGSGKDYIYGGAGDDRIMGLAGNDEIHGGQGNDLIYGGSGNDRIYGDDGVDVIFGDTPSNKNLRLAQDDDQKGIIPYIFVPNELKWTAEGVVNKFAGKNSTGEKDVVNLFDVMAEYKETSGIKDDVFDKYKSFAVSESKPKNGSDDIYGGNDSDIIFGDDGKTGASGGNDVIHGDAGDDFINGDGGNDTLYGDYGMDILYGGVGDDTLDGGAGDDFVFGDEGWKGYSKVSKTNKWLGEDKLKGEKDADRLFAEVYGDMLKIAGQNFDISYNSEYAKVGGNDTIIAGDGIDFVDGQSGDDTYKVQFQGGNKQGYTNVMDSGDDVCDTMRVLGTVGGDNVLIRASDAGLGMIALLPDGNDKKGTERVNYWKTDVNGGVDNVSVETGLGSDTIGVDGSLSTMTINGGGAEDVINIGQIYEKSALRGVNALDSFTSGLIETSEGILTAGNQHALFVDGGFSNDVFNVLHTSAPLSLEGWGGMSVYNIYGFVDESGKFVKDKDVVTITNRSLSSQESSNPIKVNYFGTKKDDIFVYSCDSVLSSCYEVLTYGVDLGSEHNIYGGDGDDAFYVMGTDMDVNNRPTINIFGNGGDDVLFGGDDKSVNDYKKVIEDLSNSNSIDVVYKRVSDSIDETDNERLLQVFEGETAEYSLSLSKKPSENVYVTISVPATSLVDANSGVNELWLVDESGCLQKSVTICFTPQNYKNPQKIKISLPENDRSDEGRILFLMQDVYVLSDSNEVFSSSNIPVFVAEKSLPISALNHIVGDSLGFDVENSSEIYCDTWGDFNLDSLQGISLLYTSKSGDKSLIPSEKQSDCDYWFSVEKNHIYIYSAKTDKLTPITGHIEVAFNDSGSVAYFLYNSSCAQFLYPEASRYARQFSYENNLWKANGGGAIDDDDIFAYGPDSDWKTTSGQDSMTYKLRNYGYELEFFDAETGNPTTLTGFFTISDSQNRTYTMFYNLGGSKYITYWNNGLPFAKIGSDYTYNHISNETSQLKSGSVSHSIVGNFEKDGPMPSVKIPSPLSLPSDSSKPTSLSRPVAPSPVASVSVSASDNVIELQSDMPDSVKVVAGETIRLKVSAAKASSADVYLMVNSEDGRALPAITWSWDDSNKKRVSVEEDGDLAYQVNLSNAENEDDFIYVFLHAAKDCNLVVTASSV